MNTDTKDMFRAAVASDLGVFLRQAFATVYPGKEYLDNWHVDAIIYLLRMAIEGRCPRLIINLPPRHLKSFIVSVVLPAFLIGRDPSVKIICVSYSDELAKTLARDFRRIIESPWYRLVFPGVKIVKSTETEIATDQGGSRFATSVGGTLTGRGGDVILLDDLIKTEDANSDRLRDGVNEWYANTLLSRLDDKRLSVLILVMQRVHVNDLTGYLEAGGGFVKLSLSAIATDDEEIPVSEHEAYLRREGEPLHAEREDEKVIGHIRNQMGEYNFWAQYQQRPQAPEGGMFKRDWFQRIERAPVRQAEGMVHISIDTALSTSESADFTAISIVYVDHRGYFVLSAERGRWTYEELQLRLREYRARYQDDVIFIVESAGIGISLISWLRRVGAVCIHYPPKGAKEVRAAYALPVIHSKRVILVGDAAAEAWMIPYLNEFCSFPHGRFDDWVDSLVQLINWSERRYGAVMQGRNEL